MTDQAKPEVVVVTGSSGGVGRAIAHAFGKRGAHVALLARGEQGLNEAKHEVESFGGRALLVPTDVSDHQAVEAAAARVEDELGPIDIWVNDAMATVFARFIDTEPEEFKRATEVTYLGAVYGTMAALKRMVPRNRGKIVQVGSALSYRAIPLQAAYCGAKFGIRGFTDSIRTELHADKSKVQITMVQLPGVNTTQFNWCRSKLPKHPMPVPPIYQPEIPAEAVYWAAHHRRRELWVGYSAVQRPCAGDGPAIPAPPRTACPRPDDAGTVCRLFVPGVVARRLEGSIPSPLRSGEKQPVSWGSLLLETRLRLPRTSTPHGLQYRNTAVAGRKGHNKTIASRPLLRSA